MSQKLICGFLAAFFLFLHGLAVGQEKGAKKTDFKMVPVPRDYRIGPQDELHIHVWKNEAMSRTVPVRPDGMISLPLIDDVRAAGLTPMELRDALVSKLVEYMPDPQVSVIVQAVRSFTVSVIGEVRKPGRIEIMTPTTVLDAIALAEGLTEFAWPSRIAILRREGGTTKRIPFNYNRAIVNGRQENLFLQPGDIVVVP